MGNLEATREIPPLSFLAAISTKYYALTQLLSGTRSKEHRIVLIPVSRQCMQPLGSYPRLVLSCLPGVGLKSIDVRSSHLRTG